jgi:hypothetical protein
VGQLLPNLDHGGIVWFAPEAAVPASPNRSTNDYTGHGVSQIDPLGLT